MSQYPDVTAHSDIQTLFENVFFVQGSVMIAPNFQISRNMIIVREGHDLTLISSVRLSEEGLKALDKLGQVKHVIRLGAYHLGAQNGLDDAFYLDRYQAKYWLMEGMTSASDSAAHKVLKDNSELPFTGAIFISYPSSNMPEGLILLERNNGILISADSFQNWLADDYFSDNALVMMQKMGFIRPANIGPEWLRHCEPDKVDFDRILTQKFRHLIPSHGVPILQTAKQELQQTVSELFRE